MAQFTTFKITRFSWNKDTKTLSAEASELRFHPQNIYGGVGIVNEKTGGYRKFRFTNVDTDGEDIFGWNFVSPDGIKLLIIND
jgi:hypothetical protein